jgi:hypothetical protein
MLEIERQQERFPDRSLKEMLREYDRNFVKPAKEEKAPPNSPYPEEGAGDLFTKKEKDKKQG